MQMLNHYIHVALMWFGQLDAFQKLSVKLECWQLLKEWNFQDNLQKCMGLW